MDGDNWNNNTNWCTDAPLNEWYGVQVEGGEVVSINLNYNNLSGDVPPEITQLTHLRDFVVYGNNITSLPENFGELKSLEYLDCDGTNLGVFPPQVLELTNLRELWLNGNGIEGQLPEGLANLTSLEYLYLYDNEFSGVLPDFLAQLTNLRVLELDVNQFEGFIPIAYFNNLSNLETFNVRWNNLTGTITKELQQSPMWQNLKYKYVREQNDGYGIDIEGAVTEIQVNSTDVTLLVGQEFQFFVTGVYPQDADNTSTYWEMDDRYQQYVSFDPATGKVKALKDGTAWINVRASDKNGAFTECRVRVISSISQGNTESYTVVEDDWDK